MRGQKCRFMASLNMEKVPLMSAWLAMIAAPVDVYKRQALYQALGIFLPLITTNCAVLGVAILVIQKDYNLHGTVGSNQRQDVYKRQVNPFFAIMPQSMLFFAIIMATGAAIIASQALISGTRCV